MLSRCKNITELVENEVYELKTTLKSIGYYEVFGTFVWPHLANLLLNELKKLHFWIPLNARSTVLKNVKLTSKRK